MTIDIRIAAYDEPAVQALVARALADLAERYGGGNGDDTPVAVTDFLPPHGRFFVATPTDSPASPQVSPALSGAVTTVWALDTVLSAPLERSSGAGGEEVPLVGCAGWRLHGADAELKRMYVAPEARGQGLARRLLATVEESARAAGRTRLILECGDRQPEAISLYESSGYCRIPDFGYYRHHPGVVSYARTL